MDLSSSIPSRHEQRNGDKASPPWTDKTTELEIFTGYMSDELIDRVNNISATLGRVSHVDLSVVQFVEMQISSMLVSILPGNKARIPPVS